MACSAPHLVEKVQDVLCQVPHVHLTANERVHSAWLARRRELRQKAAHGGQHMPDIAIVSWRQIRRADHAL